jgi:hypothetical protein
MEANGILHAVILLVTSNLSDITIVCYLTRKEIKARQLSNIEETQDIMPGRPCRTLLSLQLGSVLATTLVHARECIHAFP